MMSKWFSNTRPYDEKVDDAIDSLQDRLKKSRDELLRRKETSEQVAKDGEDDPSLEEPDDGMLQSFRELDGQVSSEDE